MPLLHHTLHLHRRYGLSHTGSAPEAVRRYDVSARAADTRGRLEDAARRKEVEEREMAAQKYKRREYTTGKLSGGWGQWTCAHLVMCGKPLEQPCPMNAFLSAFLYGVADQF